MFKLKANFSLAGDQPQAIDKLVLGVEAGLKNQVLLGVTGSGKTFTIANVIQRLQMPTLLISHNKTLAGQLYQEMRDFFPDNAISYFVSYYDYYQPEAYLPTTDTYIEKESQVNELIDKLRLQTTANLMYRQDVIVVASVSCIYNIGSPEEYRNFVIRIRVGDSAHWLTLGRQLVNLIYDRSEYELKRGTFRIRGGYMDIYPAYEDFAVRLYDKHGLIDRIVKLDPLTGQESSVKYDEINIYPAKHNLTNRQDFPQIEKQIRKDLQQEYQQFKNRGKNLEAERLLKKVNYDLELLKEVGYVNGIENYSRYFDGRKPGEAPYSLIDYFRLAYGDNFLVCVDESHMSIPQIAGMYNSDHARKRTLIDYGFRMQAAYDNRPLKFDEFYNPLKHLIFISATPAAWELQQVENEIVSRLKQGKHSPHNGVVEQLIRPTGIVDPEIIIRPARNEIPDLISEIEKRVKKNEKILITTLTKRTAEDLSKFLIEKNIRASYLHSDIDTLERSDILDKLRQGEFDVLIGVNLLREGLDLPEVTLVVILDADREGFLRSRTSLIQTMGRCARNIAGQVILYADVITGSMQQAIDEIERRRKLQLDYNRKHKIEPGTIYKPIRGKIITGQTGEEAVANVDNLIAQDGWENIKTDGLTPYDLKKLIKKLEREMKAQAEALNFERAIALRDKIKSLRDQY